MHAHTPQRPHGHSKPSPGQHRGGRSRSPRSPRQPPGSRRRPQRSPRAPRRSAYRRAPPPPPTGPFRADVGRWGRGWGGGGRGAGGAGGAARSQHIPEGGQRVCGTTPDGSPAGGECEGEERARGGERMRRGRREGGMEGGRKERREASPRSPVFSRPPPAGVCTPRPASFLASSVGGGIKWERLFHRRRPGEEEEGKGDQASWSLVPRDPAHPPLVRKPGAPHLGVGELSVMTAAVLCFTSPFHSPKPWKSYPSIYPFFLLLPNLQP